MLREWMRRDITFWAILNIERVPKAQDGCPTHVRCVVDSF